MKRTPPSPTFAVLLQDFFCERLLAQRNASPRTVASYRDAFQLLLRYIQDHRRKAPATLTLADLDAPLILAFLDHLERERRNSIRSRNARLAALRSFFRYSASRDPVHLPVIQRVLAIPRKRHDRPLLGFLTREEMAAVQSAPDRDTWSGRRDHVLFATLYNTGARVSEIVAVRAGDFSDGSTPTLRLHGKGRKERLVPLWRSTSRLLRAWIAENAVHAEAPLFPNRGHTHMTRSGVGFRLRLAVAKASRSCSSLRGRQISPHTVRHATAMALLQAGIDITVIALWLGHESPTTTHCYVEADLAMKRRALEKMPKLDRAVRTRGFAPRDSVLAFLEGL